MIRHLACLLLAVSCTTQFAHAAPPSIPKALVVVGPWGDMFRWREAMHAGGVLYEEALRVMNVYHGGVRVYGLPQTAEQLAGYSTVVLVNMDAPTLGEKNLALLRDFVHGGGGLVVLGGEWAFQRGGYADTVLAEMLPVEMPAEDRIPVNRAGDALQLAASSSLPQDLDFAAAPRSYYAHTLAAKPGTIVELHVGDRPAIVSGKFGEGRVTACGLTIHGKSSADATPFWDWAEWPRLLGHVVDATASTRAPADMAASSLKPLSAEEISQVQLRFQPLTAEFAERFAASPTAPAAAALFDQLFADKPVRVKITPAVVAALASFAQPEWEKPLLKWTDSLNPEAAHRNAAIELLGAARGTGAGSRLLELLADTDVAPAALDGLRRLDDPKHLPLLLSLYERNLAAADFRTYGTPGAFSPGALRSGIVAVRAAAALYALGDPQGTARLAGLFREIRLLRRIHSNAAKRRVGDTDAQGQAIRANIIKKAEDLSELNTYLLEVAGPIPVRARAAFIDYAQSAADDSEIHWLTAGLLRSTDQDWSPLAGAKDGIVRRIAGLK